MKKKGLFIASLLSGLIVMGALPACAVSIDCDGGMEVGQEAEPAA